MAARFMSTMGPGIVIPGMFIGIFTSWAAANPVSSSPNGINFTKNS
jgi:hypothetical protein